MTAIAVWDNSAFDACGDDAIQAYEEDSLLISKEAHWLDRRDESPTSFADVVPIEPHREYKAVLSAILESRSILALADNWDDEGSVGYLEQTWKRATDFLHMQALAARSTFHVRLAAPLIAPASNGSIDIFWSGREGKLLLNFPSNDDAFATYYGETSRGDTTGGQILSDRPRLDLIQWASQIS